MKNAGMSATSAARGFASSTTAGRGGVMIWSLDYDLKGERSLLSTIHDALRPAR